MVFEEGSALRKIEDRCFAWSRIRAVTIPSGVTEIGVSAFFACNQLRSVRFAEGSALEKLGSSCFLECAIETIALPSTVRSIGETAFDMRTFRTVVIPEGCTVGE